MIRFDDLKKRNLNSKKKVKKAKKHEKSGPKGFWIWKLHRGPNKAYFNQNVVLMDSGLGNCTVVLTIHISIKQWS